MKTVLTGLTILVFLVALLGSALAQRPSPGPEEERMAQMMKMMEQMQGQMKQMHEQMGHMKQMQTQMSQMKQMHEQMAGMMQQHRAEMQKGCPGATVPDSPKKGGG
jgi:TolA-binding protein